MNDEKERFITFFCLPLVALVGLYYLLVCYFSQQASLIEPQMWSMIKYAFVTYAGWFDIDLGQWMFELPKEWQQSGEDVIKVPAMQYVTFVDKYAASRVYSAFPFYVVVVTVFSFVVLAYMSGDYCAVKAPGLNGNSATILPFSPSHSIVERQLNAI